MDLRVPRGVTYRPVRYRGPWQRIDFPIPLSGLPQPPSLPRADTRAGVEVSYRSLWETEEPWESWEVDEFWEDED